VAGRWGEEEGQAGRRAWRKGKCRGGRSVQGKAFSAVPHQPRQPEMAPVGTKGYGVHKRYKRRPVRRVYHIESSPNPSFIEQATRLSWLKRRRTVYVR